MRRLLRESPTKLLLLGSKTLTAAAVTLSFAAITTVGCTPKALDPSQGHLDNFSAAAPNGATGTTNIGGRADDEPIGGTASGTTQAPSPSASPTSAAPAADAAQPAAAKSAPSAAASPKPAVKEKKHK